MKGWIKIAREINQHWIWEDDSKFKWWIDLLLSAAWEDKHVLVGTQLVELKRGQLIASLSFLCKRWGRSRSVVEPFLKLLIQDNMITKEMSNNISIITVVNYNQYQDGADLSCIESNSVSDDCKDTDTHHDAHLGAYPCAYLHATNEEYKNINNKALENAPAREGKTNPETWRFISSVRRFSLNNDPNKIADFKKELFRREVEELNKTVGMPEDLMNRFIDWWTEHSPGNESISAEFQATFNTESRMRGWMDRERQKQRPAQSAPTQKSRTDSFEENMNFIHNFFNNGDRNANTTPDEQ